MKLEFEIRKLLGQGNLSRSVCRDFDQRRGYAAYHEACKAARQRSLPTSPDRELETLGHVRLSLLAPHEVTEVKADAEQFSVHLDRNSYSEPFEITDRAFMARLLERVITPEVDRHLLGFFESEYVPYWTIYNRTPPNRTPRRAFLWHCDKGPTAAAKLILYLTDAAECGGRTDLIEREATRAFDRIGYVFGGQPSRLEDLSALAQRHALSLDPKSYAPDAGEALLFLPRFVLHRGVPPTRAPRCAFQIVFLPSPRPWREALALLEANPPPERENYAWAKRAHHLMPLLSGTA